MKKIIFILMGLIPGMVFSQSIGFKAGAVFSTTNYAKAIDEKNLTSPVFGVVYQHSFNKFLLSVEPGFTTKGFTNSYRVTDNSGNFIRSEKASYKFSYFELPVLLGYSIVDKDLYFGLNAGIAANFLTSAKAKSPKFDSELTGNNGFMVDVLGGGYVGYKLSENLFAAVNLRYGKGLTKVHPNSDGGYSYFTTFLNIGYKF